MDEKAVFLATVPPIQSAIKIGDLGMRLQLDVPETELGNALDILAWRSRVLRVTIEPVKQGVSGGEPGTVEARRKRKSKWQTTQE